MSVLSSSGDGSDGDTNEYQPLVEGGLLGRDVSDGSRGQNEEWKRPRGFLWIEIAIFSAVFLCGFDGTITASTYPTIGSEFHAFSTISWLTTSYLLTSTAFQPLYGRFSDLLGRRSCFFTATLTFAVGCLGCGVAPNILTLNTMRALTGLGGGGLMTMATVINSDIIPFKQRGMYQAMQNALFGFGAICGASLGGIIADHIGWRVGFLGQVPIALASFFVGYFAIKEPVETVRKQDVSTWKQIDLSGAVLLVTGLSAQLAALSMGGNQYPWSDWRVIGAFAASVVLLALFARVEFNTKAIPIMPMNMLKGRLAISNLLSNVCVGMAAYAFLFMAPLFFQTILHESPSTAGLRLVIPSLATPVGGLIAGIVMSHFGGHLAVLVRVGAFLMMLGNVLVATLKYPTDSKWKYIVFLFPANLGQGIAYPSILFTFLAAFGHEHQAVSTSTVYLFRSVGTVWGVAASSTLIQNFLARQLPMALSEVPNKEKIIARILEEVTYLNELDPVISELVRRVYYDALRLGFLGSGGIAAVALVAAFWAKGRSLER